MDILITEMNLWTPWAGYKTNLRIKIRTLIHIFHPTSKTRLPLANLETVFSGLIHLAGNYLCFSSFSCKEFDYERYFYILSSHFFIFSYPRCQINVHQWCSLSNLFGSTKNWLRSGNNNLHMNTFCRISTIIFYHYILTSNIQISFCYEC